MARMVHEVQVHRRGGEVRVVGGAVGVAGVCCHPGQVEFDQATHGVSAVGRSYTSNYG